MNDEVRTSAGMDDLRKIAEGVAAATGEAFFRSLVESLTQTLEVDYAFVVRLTSGPPEKGRTIAGFGKGKHLPPLEYDLRGTPCENVVNRKVCCYPQEVQRKFPADRYLAELAIESYVGIPLVDAADKVLGLIAAMHTQPLARPDFAVASLRIWAARASAELQRLSAEMALRESEARFRNLFENSPVAIFVEDLEGKVLDVNRAACALHETTREDLVGKHVLELVPLHHRAQAEEDFDRLIRGEADGVPGYCRTRTGRAVPVSIRVSRIEYGGGPALLLHVRDMSDQMRAEQELRDSRTILEKAQAIGQVGSWMSDASDSGWLSWSDETCRIVGVRPEEFDGRRDTFLRIVYPDDLPLVQEARRAALAGERPYAVEHRIVRADGQVRWVRQQADVERDAAGRPRRMIGVVRDITEQKAAEHSLRESEARFRAIFNSEPECVKLLDRQGRVLEMNRAGLDLIEADHLSVVVGRDVFGLILPEHREAFAALLAQVMDGQSGELVYQIEGLRGTQRWMDTHGTPLRDASGEIVAGLFVTRDITARKAAEEALQASEERFRALVENGFEGMSVVDAQGVITYTSPASLRMIGYPDHKIMGTKGLDHVHPEDLPAARELFDQLLAHPHQSYCVVLRVRHRDGSWRWAEIAVRNLLDHPAVQGIVVNWRDVTDRKLAAEKLAQQQAELLHVSRLSTMGQLVAALTHEIAQPLAAINNYAGACCGVLETNGSASEPALSYVRQIARESQRAGAILKRLRTFGSKSTPDREICDLNWLLKDSVELVASELRRRGLAVRLELADPPPTAWVDRVQFQQVLVNLLTNACDAIQNLDSGRRVITVRSAALDGDAVVEVEDRGIGLTETVRKSLYQPFFTTKPEGMGLGLSICQTIVEEHGGKIEALNNEHGGATFRLRFPRRGT
jgi:PAS domain S-box-containing protein